MKMQEGSGIAHLFYLLFLFLKNPLKNAAA